MTAIAHPGTTIARPRDDQRTTDIEADPVVPERSELDAGAAEDLRRFGLYRKSLIAGAPLLALVVGLSCYLTGFTHGAGSIAIGLVIAFWVTPLVAGVAACGLYGAEHDH